VANLYDLFFFCLDFATQIRVTESQYFKRKPMLFLRLFTS